MGSAYYGTCFSSLIFSARATSRIVVASNAGDLNTVIGSGFSVRWPLWFTQVPNSVALMSNGIDPMQRWDSSTGIMEVAGVPPPLTSVTVKINGVYSAQASGALIYAFCRFYDEYGNFSDLSPVGAASYGVSTVQPSGQQTIPTTTSPPFPTPAAIYGGAPNAATGTGSNGTCASTTVGTALDIPSPTGPYKSKVVGRQLLRNTPGQATTFYVDIDTRDLTSTTLYSYNNDAFLETQEAVPLLTSTGALFANTHGFPPSWKAVTASYLSRIFATAEQVYNVGNVIVTSGSTTVTGVGTSWPQNFNGRRLFISNPPGEYEIASVNTALQTLTLTGSYNGPTDQFAIYGIRAPASEWRLIYYTPSGEPESWPATYALSLQDDGDEITGLMQLGSFLYILEKRHIYRLTFLTDPAVDGAIFLSSRRGCLGQRLWVQAEATAYLFDQLGVHSFTGGSSVPISDPIQDMWRDNGQSSLVINWNADTNLWSCSYNATHTTIRFFVAMNSSRYPHHALCFNYRQNRWWIEEYSRPICSTTSMQIGAITYTVAGTDANNVISLDVGYLDGTRGIVPTIGGTVSSATTCSMTDSLASFTDEIVNLQLSITQGRAKGQSRRIISVTNSGTRLTLKTPWNILPEAGDYYEVAAIPWMWQPGWFRFLDDAEGTNARDVEVLYQPLSEGTTDLEIYFNRSIVPRTWVTDRTGTATVTSGDSRVEIDMTDTHGRGIFRMEGHRERYIDGDIYVSPKLSGFQHGEPIRIYRMTIVGASQET